MTLSMHVIRLLQLQTGIGVAIDINPEHQPWVALIYGGQKYIYDFHNKTGFNFYWLWYLLGEAGFVEVSTYSNVTYFIPKVIDSSLANEPFGEFISLNVIAKRTALVNR